MDTIFLKMMPYCLKRLDENGLAILLNRHYAPLGCYAPLHATDLAEHPLAFRLGNGSAAALEACGLKYGNGFWFFYERGTPTNSQQEWAQYQRVLHKVAKLKIESAHVFA